jgi:hypothetical protein
MSITTTWPLRIEVDDLPPSPNRRMHWGTRRRLVKPDDDAAQMYALAHVLGARDGATRAQMVRGSDSVRPQHPRRPLGGRARRGLGAIRQPHAPAGRYAGCSPAQHTQSQETRWMSTTVKDAADA